MFKGIFDFKNYFINIRWVILIPIIIYLFVGIMALSSTSSYVSFFLFNFL